MNFIPLLQETVPAQGGSFMTIIMFVLIFVIFYFFIIRPQNKKQKETERMIDAIKKGDKVITIGGLHGEVSAVREKTFVIKVEDGSKMDFSRSAISTVVNPIEEAAAAKAEKEKPKKGLFGKSSDAEEKKDDAKDVPATKQEASGEAHEDSEKKE